jgi:hypothetical protein
MRYADGRAVIHIGAESILDVKMTPKIVLHVGLHKSGTSYIQEFLARNRQKLEELGIFYPPLSNSNHTAFVAWSRKDLNIGKQKQTEWLELNVRRGEPIVLSSEEFSTDLNSPARAEHYSEILKNFDVKIVYYLRRQDHLFESVYSEVSKSRFTGDIHDAKFSPFIFDFYRRLKPSLEVFGSNSIIIRPYNKNQWSNGELAEDFLFHALGIRFGEWLMPERQNASISRRKTIFLAGLNLERLTKRKIYEAIKTSDCIKDDGIRFCANPVFRDAFYNIFRSTTRDVLKNFGVKSPDDFLGYDGQKDIETWFPAEPLSRGEVMATLDCLHKNGIEDLNEADLISEERG